MKRKWISLMTALLIFAGLCIPTMSMGHMPQKQIPLARRKASASIQHSFKLNDISKIS